MAYQFYISLQDSQPLIWRRILIPELYTFYQLHLAIQGAFGWENCHLFQFCENELSDSKGIGIPYKEWDDKPITDARQKRISNVFTATGATYLYVYDLGDCWKHRIILEALTDQDCHHPFCQDGVGACPPEDAGGMQGYMYILRILSLPSHPEKQRYREWLGLREHETWDPSYCSIREINKRFALLDYID